MSEKLPEHPGECPEKCPDKEIHVCNGCCGTGEGEEPEIGENEVSGPDSEDLEFEEPEAAVSGDSEGEEQEKITVTTSMDIQGTHFIYTQATEKSLKILDYDYKRCNGCGFR